MEIWKWINYGCYDVPPAELTTPILTKVVISTNTVWTGNDYLHPTMGHDHSDNELYLWKYEKYKIMGV